MIEDVRDRLRGLLDEYVALDAELRKLEDTEFRVCIFGSARIRPEDPVYQTVVVAPGGIGTVLALMYVWQLLQVGMMDPRPVILLGRDFWAGLIAWMREQQLGKGFISEHDLEFVHLVDSPKEVVQVIRKALEAYQQSHQLVVEELPEDQ